MNEFNWDTAEYPCLGQNIHDNRVICFSSYGVGHYIDDADDCSNYWDMKRFQPYTPPKPKTKLWYWEYLNNDKDWILSTIRLTEEQAKEHFYSDKDYRKLTLDFIEVEE